MCAEIGLIILIMLCAFGFIIFSWSLIGLIISYYSNSSIDGHRNPPFPPKQK